MNSSQQPFYAVVGCFFLMLLSSTRKTPVQREQLRSKQRNLYYPRGQMGLKPGFTSNNVGDILAVLLRNCVGWVFFL